MQEIILAQTGYASSLMTHVWLCPVLLVEQKQRVLLRRTSVLQSACCSVYSLQITVYLKPQGDVGFCMPFNTITVFDNGCEGVLVSVFVLFFFSVCN